MSSKAHAVQTSARASTPVEKDMFAGTAECQAATVKALQYTGQLLNDATVAQRAINGDAVPVVTFDMSCHVGAVRFTVHVEQPFTPATRAAAGAKAAHCRKGRWVEVNATHEGVCIALPQCHVRVLEGRPQ